MKLDGRRMSDNISDHHRENMKRQIGADGDFAYAYVIAHEVGQPRTILAQRPRPRRHFLAGIRQHVTFLDRYYI